MLSKAYLNAVSVLSFSCFQLIYEHFNEYHMTVWHTVVHVVFLEHCMWIKCLTVVTGQLTDTPTRRLPSCRLDDSWTGHLEDWSTCGLDNSQTAQVADWTTCRCHRRLWVLSFRFWPLINVFLCAYLNIYYASDLVVIVLGVLGVLYVHT